MKIRSLATTTAVALAAIAAGAAGAAEISVSGDISTSQNWTKDNVYYLSGQVYVRAGATLTIQAGTTVIADNPTGTNPGSLAVCRGARITCVGTALEPVIFTSRNDYNTWTAGNRLSGTYRKGTTNEWGNLTIMGRAYIGKYGNTAAGSNAPATNTAAPNASNYANMEGLTAADDRVRYGGGDDLDNSGSLRFTSFRYGGFTVSSGVELNGISLGAIGSDTVIDHVDITNNLDDGIEIWGGTVNLKYVNIWNIGDDCFDVDQGWRGRAQFGLLVAGYSRSGNTGSGMPDKCFEMDGAEYADAQPVGTACIYNFTAIEQPNMNTKMIGLRDNMRVQFHNCVFMDGGAQVLNNDGGDNEAGNGGLVASGYGYGYNGTVNFNNSWSTAWNTFSTVNPFADGPTSHYRAMSSGKLIEFTDSVFYNNAASNAYTELQGGSTPGTNHPSAFASANNNVLGSLSPIQSITREATASGVTNSSGLARLVTSLDPRPANDAVSAVGSAPNDGIFTPAAYKGAFAPGTNWACGWTSAAVYGMLANCPAACPADLNGDRIVDGADLGLCLGAWGTASADLNSDGTTDGADLGLLLGAWGSCP